MRRLTRGRAATDDEAPPPERGASDAVGDAGTEPTPDGVSPDAATVAAGPIVEAPAAREPAPSDATVVAEQPAANDVPAGLDADELAAGPAPIARRSRVRRRLRYLRHARELLLRDLGGFYYEAQRTEEGAGAHGRLLEVKARRLAVLDAEMRELEERLGEPHGETVLREPAIGGTCPHCGELHGSDARFCPRCGNPLGRGGRRPDAAPATGAQPYEEQGRPTTASLWGRRRTPQPPSAAEATQATGDEAARNEAVGDAAARNEAVGGEAAARTEIAGDPAARDEAAAEETATGGADQPRGNGAAARADEAAADETSVGAADPRPERRP